jgi:RNA polymerase sigma-70 factor (ECF subfamily)
MVKDTTTSETGPAQAALDPSAYIEQQFREHRRALESFVRARVNDAEVAKDIVNDVFVRVLRLPDPMRIGPNPRSYLFTVALNLITDWRRRRSVRAKSADQLADASATERPLRPDEALESDEIRRRLSVAFATLDERHRRAFVMSRLEDRSYAEIAAELGVSLRTVERYICEALTRLRQELDGD